MKRILALITLLSALLSTAGLPLGTLAATVPTPLPPPGSSSAAFEGAAVPSLPLAFIPNVGQSGPPVRFLAYGGGTSLFFLTDGVVLASAQRRPLRIRFEEADPAPRMSGGERLPGIVNYFIGDDPSQWRTGLPTYGALVYESLYPGIDLRYEGRSGVLKSTYYVAPGGDPARIRYRYEGAEIALQDGALWLDGAAMVEHAPVAWQEIGGRRLPVSVRYRLYADGSVGFEVGRYDPAYPLVIDPALIYGSYLGGSGDDIGNGITLDGNGNIYVVGYTYSSDFPVQSPYQGTSGGDADVFVTKLSADGTTLLYSTYLGGSDFDRGMAIAVDSAGRAYITGDTISTDFPTANAIQPNYGGDLVSGGDVFVAELSANGSSLLFSTYLGGSYDEYGMDIAVQPSGGVAYVTGYTNSRDFPVNNAYQSTYGGDDEDAFVARIEVSGPYTWTYLTYFGGSQAAGSGLDAGRGIAVDSSGIIYVVGTTGSQADFPLKNAYNSTYNGGGSDAFIARFDPSQSGSDSLLSSTFFGGNGNDPATGVALDSSGNPYIVGSTTSTNLPIVGGYQTTFAGGDGDAYVARFNSAVSSLAYSSYLGGSKLDSPQDIAVEGENAYIVGWTESTDLPLVNEVQSTFGGGDDDLFAAKFDTTLTGQSSLRYSTYIGGRGSDESGYEGAAVKADGTFYLTGLTGSSDFPLHQPYQGSYGGGTFDAIIVALGPSANLAVFQSDAPDPVAVSSLVTYTVVVENQGPEDADGVVLTDTLPASLSLHTYNITQGSCTSSNGQIVCSVGLLAATLPATLTVIGAPSAPGTLSNQAEVSSNIFDTDLMNNTSVETTTVLLPDLTLVKRESADPALVGSPLTYTLVITNGGGLEATQVVLTETLPAGVLLRSVATTQGSCAATATLTCTLGTIPPQAGVTVTIAVTPTAPGILINSAEVASGEPDDDPMDNIDSITTTVTQPDLVLTKQGTPASVLISHPLTYTLIVTNTGGWTATHVILTDTLPVSLSLRTVTATQGSCLGAHPLRCDLGSLAPGKTASVRLVVTPTAAATLINRAEVSEVEPDGNAADNIATSTTSVIPAADLVLSKEITPALPISSAPLTYTLVVTNQGPSPATGILLTDTLPTSMTVQVITATQGTCGGSGIVSCALGSLAVGERATVTLAVTTSLQGDRVTNRAEVAANETDPHPQDNVAALTHYVNAADLQLTIVDSPDPAGSDVPMTYTVIITNAGPAAAHNVVISDSLSPGAVYYSNGGDCSLVNINASQTELGCLLGTVPAGQSRRFHVQLYYRHSGFYTNTAWATSSQPDPATWNNRETERTTVNHADIALTMRGEPSIVGTVEVITYTLSAGNLGPGRAGLIIVTDTLPVGGVIETSPYCTPNTARNQVVCYMGSLLPGYTKTVWFRAYYTRTGLITNTAVAGSDVISDVLANNTASVAVLVGDARREIDARTGSRIDYSDGQGGGTTVEIAAGTVTTTTTLLYTAHPTATPPSGFRFAGHAFALDAYRNGVKLDSFALQKPITVTLRYADADVAGIDEKTLVLDYWDGSRWVDAATSCTPTSTYDRHPDQNWLSVAICHLTDFGLMGSDHYAIYLPLVLRNR